MAEEGEQLTLGLFVEDLVPVGANLYKKVSRRVGSRGAMTTREVAVKLQVSQRTVQNLVSIGREGGGLDSVPAGIRRRKVPPEEVIRWLEERK